MLTTQDLQAIETLLDKKLDQKFAENNRYRDHKLDQRFSQFEEKLDKKLDEKFAQNNKIRDASLDERFKRELKPIKASLRRLNKKLDLVITTFDNDINHIWKRMNRVEDHLNLPPISS